ncbi:rod-binding protein [Pseudaestuariivita rosea]|uniref:rod-binding protein n=1 Tax=Pseudaestuariivita rosea TaxID=2763263 RepID=UPI003AF53E77
MQAVGLPPQTTQHNQRLKEVAAQMETAFLSEMLKSAGLGTSRETLGGGAGEDQFQSFLRQAQAEQMVKSGGIGLSEAIFESLKQKVDENDPT